MEIKRAINHFQRKNNKQNKTNLFHTRGQTTPKDEGGVVIGGKYN